MTLPRKDVRCKFESDIHEALSRICEVEKIEIGEYVEREISRVVRKCIHDARLIAKSTERLGLIGNRRERAGTSGSAQ